MASRLPSKASSSSNLRAARAGGANSSASSSSSNSPASTTLGNSSSSHAGAAAGAAGGGGGDASPPPHAPTPEEIKRQRGLEAQRAFRARKAAHLQELENKVATLEYENTRLKVENDRLKEDNSWLKKEFEKLSEGPKEVHLPPSASPPSSSSSSSYARRPDSDDLYHPHHLPSKAAQSGQPATSALHSPRYHPYGGPSATSHPHPQQPYGGPALPRILPRHAPSLPSISDSVLVNLPTTDLSRAVYSGMPHPSDLRGAYQGLPSSAIRGLPSRVSASFSLVH